MSWNGNGNQWAAWNSGSTPNVNNSSIVMENKAKSGNGWQNNNNAWNNWNGNNANNPQNGWSNWNNHNNQWQKSGNYQKTNAQNQDTYNSWNSSNSGWRKPKGTAQEWGKTSCWEKDYGAASQWGKPSGWNQQNNWNQNNGWSQKFNSWNQQGNAWNQQASGWNQQANNWYQKSEYWQTQANKWNNQGTFLEQQPRQAQGTSNNGKPASNMTKIQEKKQGKSDEKTNGSDFNALECKLCFNGESTMMNKACRHLMMCEQCFQAYSNKHGGTNRLPCPLCNTVGEYFFYVAPIYS